MSSCQGGAEGAHTALQRCAQELCHLLKLQLTARTSLPRGSCAHVPLERPDKGVRCVLHGSPFVLEGIVTSEGCA